MQRGWIAALLVLITGTLQGQVLDNSEGKTFGEDPFFNQQFIQQNKIKTIVGNMSTKELKDRIREGRLEYQYHFDADGKLSDQMMAIHRRDGRVDSTVVSYEYNAANHLTRKRLNDSHGFYSYSYELNDAGQCTKETYFREENIGPSRFEFKLGKQYVISSESYSYGAPSDTMKRKKVYNNYGKAYMREDTYFNTLGYKLMEEVKYIVNGRRSRVFFEYDEKGYVSKRIDQPSLRDTTKTISTFTYDEVGNLLEENIYRNDKHLTIKQYLYDDRMLMKATLTKDVETEVITIVQYEYTFYE